jgi:hypothetical protein
VGCGGLSTQRPANTPDARRAKASAVRWFPSESRLWASSDAIQARRAMAIGSSIIRRLYLLFGATLLRLTG